MAGSIEVTVKALLLDATDRDIIREALRGVHFSDPNRQKALESLLRELEE